MLRKSVNAVRFLSKAPRVSQPKKNTSTSRSPMKSDTNPEISVQQSAKGKRRNALPWIVGGVAVYGAGVGVSMLFMGSSSKDSAAANGTPVTEAERRQVYDAGAAAYETEVCSTEDWTGISAVRRQLVAQATGRVLEVAAGTGINLTRDLYPASCCVTCVDCRSRTAVAHL